ncbi:MAG: hypothetical protein IT379_13145 [Deltaproteobacteria bacterium]|nr:hypothetical protein [Deltaproteobacteria bacterium]
MTNHAIHVVLASLLFGAASCGGNDPTPFPIDAGRGLDAARPGPHDAGEPADRGVELADAAPENSQDAAGPASCQPACGSGSVCCTDQHGHFPQCVTGAECP